TGGRRERPPVSLVRRRWNRESPPSISARPGRCESMARRRSSMRAWLAMMLLGSGLLPTPTDGVAAARAVADTSAAPALPPDRALPPPRDAAPDSAFRAHEVPRDSLSSVHPCLRIGSLLLAGGGPGQPDLAERFVRLAG